jgi:hypothetical protein
VFEWVRNWIASNPNTPVPLLVKLAEDKDEGVRKAVVANSNVPTSLLEKKSVEGVKADELTIPSLKIGESNIKTEIVNYFLSKANEEEIAIHKDYFKDTIFVVEIKFKNGEDLTEKGRISDYLCVDDYEYDDEGRLTQVSQKELINNLFNQLDFLFEEGDRKFKVLDVCIGDKMTSGEWDDLGVCVRKDCN